MLNCPYKTAHHVPPVINVVVLVTLFAIGRRRLPLHPPTTDLPRRRNVGVEMLQRKSRVQVDIGAGEGDLVVVKAASDLYDRDIIGFLYP